MFAFKPMQPGMQNCVYAFAAVLENAHASIENSGVSLFFPYFFCIFLC